MPGKLPRKALPARHVMLDSSPAARRRSASFVAKKALKAWSASFSPSNCAAAAESKNSRRPSQRDTKSLSSSPPQAVRNFIRGVLQLSGVSSPESASTSFGLDKSSNAARRSSKVGRRASSTRMQDNMTAYAASETPSGKGKPSLMIASSCSASPFSKSSANKVNFAVTTARFSHPCHGDWPSEKNSQKVAPRAQTSVRWLILF
mmetsp:Transcript_102442/g.296305  ORF Transcript_102442/g.296305 Transcript_102442/m.296305 type:complete len:204 (-) Transcript_102442:692-1303(-)